LVLKNLVLPRNAGFSMGSVRIRKEKIGKREEVVYFLIPSCYFLKLTFDEANLLWRQQNPGLLGPDSLLPGTRILVPGGGDLRRPDNVVPPADDLGRIGIDGSHTVFGKAHHTADSHDLEMF
jgi:hypothetical protein